jgi:hypothetical protein
MAWTQFETAVYIASCTNIMLHIVRYLRYTGLFEMFVRVLTTCHTQHTWDSSICIFLLNRTTLSVFVTYLTGALYVHPLWFYKHQHDKLFVACQRWWFQWRFWFVPGFSFSLFRKMCHVVGCDMPSFVLPLTFDSLGLHTNACLTSSTCSSVSDGLPVFFFYKRTLSLETVHTTF